MSASFALFDSPIGTCSLVWKDRSIVGLRLPEQSVSATRARIKRRWPGAEECTPPADMQAVVDRVLGADGKMGGFSATGGVAVKRRILEIEGAAAVGAGPLFATLQQRG